MNNKNNSVAITAGLAIFAMLFGAGNLVFPPYLGALAGTKTAYSLTGFIITGVLLPLMGLVGISLFDGNYKEFFNRLGNIPGKSLTLICILIMGPLYAMPRISAFVYTMMSKFMPEYITSLRFGAIFGLVTFIFAAKQNKLLDLMGKILSPIKIICILIAIIAGFVQIKSLTITGLSSKQAFLDGFFEGYNTLDLLAAIFFGYVIVAVLKQKLEKQDIKKNQIAEIMFKAGAIGCSLLAGIYIGMGYIGAFHGTQFVSSNDAAQVFVNSLLEILGNYGSLVVAVMIFVACISTMVALATVSAKYLEIDILKNKISFIPLLCVVILVTVLLSKYNFGSLVKLYTPIISIAYPVIIILTICNILYATKNIKTVKIPVLITFIVSTSWTVFKIVG